VKTVKLSRLAEVIRSKNAGPYELTLDIIFRDEKDYGRLKRSGFFTEALFARLYGVGAASILGVVHFDPACAVKATMRRPRVSGDPGDTDVYGAQQHAPLLDLEIPEGGEIEEGPPADV